jgi:hypothetical protein
LRGEGPPHVVARQDGGGGLLANPREGRSAWRRNGSRSARTIVG